MNFFSGNMDAAQLCRMISTFNDSLISLCPENSYFWITQLFVNYTDHESGIKCLDSCKVIASHAYSLNIDFSSKNFGLAAYDLGSYVNSYGNKPIWQTEVSSTYLSPEDHELEEGLSFATNIINFLGTTCVERYYFWLAYSNGPSGESLIWGYPATGKLYFPKKYYIYNHFTNASMASLQKNSSVRIKSCITDNNSVNEPVAPCLHFDSTTTVFVNNAKRVVKLPDSTDCSCSLCCTTDRVDISCHFRKRELPSKSVCTCTGGCGTGMEGVGNANANRHEKLPYFVVGYVFIDNLLSYIF